jgi:hypothetical protein
MDAIFYEYSLAELDEQTVVSIAGAIPIAVGEPALTAAGVGIAIADRRITIFARRILDGTPDVPSSLVVSVKPTGQQYDMAVVGVYLGTVLRATGAVRHVFWKAD